VLERRPVPAISSERLEEALDAFRGTFAQVPPMYSAVKVGGRRLYELAREGKEVDRAPREVTVHQLILRDFSATRVQLSVECSKGFFVRTLAAELGESLGCGAHLVALRRTRSGPFGLGEAVALTRVLEGREGVRGQLVPMGQALVDLRPLTVSAVEAERVRHGGVVEVPVGEQGLVRVLGPAGELLAVAEAQRGRLVYRRVL
jgi:tRNA pseudouridine55 synthase